MTPPEKEASKYTFKELNKDLDDLYQTLKQENFKNHEIKRLMDPIISKTFANQRNSNRIIKSLSKALLIIATILIATYLLTFWDTFYWHLTALTRIFMIKLLPYFDWRYLKNEQCLVPKFFDQADQNIPPQNQEIFNCALCESRRTFDQITFNSDQNIEEMIRRFIDLDRPVIVDGGIDHWIKKSPDKFIDQLINEKEFLESVPCRLSTDVHNLRHDMVDLKTLIKKSKFFDTFFMHFQNCELEAMKLFRKLTYRPKALPEELSPVTYNWLVWNKNYNSTKWRRIDLIEKYTVVGQMFGKIRLKLTPRKNCENECPILEGLLTEGQFLVLTSLWDVEYSPGSGGENMAAILEIKG